MNPSPSHYLIDSAENAVRKLKEAFKDDPKKSRNICVLLSIEDLSPSGEIKWRSLVGIGSDTKSNIYGRHKDYTPAQLANAFIAEAEATKEESKALAEAKAVVERIQKQIDAKTK